MKNLEFPLDTILEVLWEDACTDHGWSKKEDYLTHGIMPCKSVGYLLKKNKQELVLTTTQALNDSMNGAIAIPIGWIQRIRRLK